MKKLPLIVLLSVAFTTATSQSFMHGIGFTALGGRLGNRNTSINEGLTYSPRFNFLEKTNLSLSVGIPFTVGITGNYNSSYNTYSGSSTTNTLGLLLNVPLVINFNFGSGASKQTKKGLAILRVPVADIIMAVLKKISITLMVKLSKKQSKQAVLGWQQMRAFALL